MSGTHALELAGTAGDASSRVHRLDPRAKLLATVGLVVIAVSAPLAAWPAYAACGAALAAIATAARVGPDDIWRRVRWVLPLVLAVAAVVPFVRSGGAEWALGPLTVHEDGLAVLATVAAKATIGVCAAAILTASTPLPELMRGLERLRVPRVLVLIALFMYRYLFVIVEEAGRMRAALLARGYRPRHALRAGALGRMATASFLRTYERGERVHLAMLARGYSGAMPTPGELRLTGADAAFVATVVSLPLLVRVLAGAGA